VQLGGGIRDEAAIGRALDAGVARVVVGTRAAAGDDFVVHAVQRFGGDKIAVGIDARDGFVAVRGWTEGTKIMAYDLAKQAGEWGVGAVIYTDIATDGMLQGPNMKAVASVVTETKAPVIASGGVSSASDLCVLAQIEGLSGAIIGKALFDGLIKGHLRAAMAEVDQ
jgi:phosphoribosylformimino-5-aminoimidazole carboxamide ribotide isomerase